MPRFFASLVALVNEERLYAPVLFEDDPRGSVEAFVASTVLALEPGYGATLDGAALKKEMTKSKRKSCVCPTSSGAVADPRCRLQNHQSPPNNPMAQSF